MTQDFNHLNENEKLKAENEFLKMKLMLENGAEFTSINTENELPPELENQFLNYIAEFEKQYQQQKTITVFDKIERPAHFKPAAEIPDSEIENAWARLSGYLNKYSIHLDVCSPNISIRELYRFTIEELFAHEMDGLNIPGMNTCFIYDEFHPDPVYDNTKAALQNCISRILEKRPLEWTHDFSEKNLRLNKHHPLTRDEFQIIVNRFKLAYDSLKKPEISEPYCVVNGRQCTVTGTYRIAAKTGKDKIYLAGQWAVGFEQEEDESAYWYITAVDIEGIVF